MKQLHSQNERQPVWAEIKSDHHEETDGFIVAHIDAWKTGNGDEEGEVIAKVVGAMVDGKPKTYVSHQNVLAMVDNAAIEEIQNAVKEVVAALVETAIGKTEIRRVRRQDGVYRMYQFFGWKQGQADGEALADILFVDSHAPNFMCMAHPPSFDVNDKVRPAVTIREHLEPELKAKLEKAVQGTLNEIDAEFTA